MKTNIAILLAGLAVSPAHTKQREEIQFGLEKQYEFTIALPARIVNSFYNDPLMTQEEYAPSQGNPSQREVYDSALLSIERARVWNFLQEPCYADQFIVLAGKQMSGVNKALAQRLELILETSQNRDEISNGLNAIGRELTALSAGAGYDTSKIEYTVFYNPRKAENKR